MLWTQELTILWVVTNQVFNVGEYEVSVVGGRYGLYGDFVDTFELAIFDKEE